MKMEGEAFNSSRLPSPLGYLLVGANMLA
jgi:hypothetical protein